MSIAPLLRSYDQQHTCRKHFCQKYIRIGSCESKLQQAKSVNFKGEGRNGQEWTRCSIDRSLCIGYDQLILWPIYRPTGCYRHKHRKHLHTYKFEVIYVYLRLQPAQLSCDMSDKLAFRDNTLSETVENLKQLHQHDCWAQWRF